VGGRAGVPTSAAGVGFKEAEGFANFQLPWRWDLGKDWQLEPRLDSSLGWLADARVNAVRVTLGPTFVLGWRHLPVTLEAGVSPTYLSRYHFTHKNLGFPLEFTSHAGLNWEFTPHFRLSYWFQHMSNAGLSADNPGLNLHVIGLGYVF
jgi:hypothetical protein